MYLEMVIQCFALNMPGFDNDTVILGKFGTTGIFWILPSSTFLPLSDKDSYSEEISLFNKPSSSLCMIS
jgi:hypothetical protein